jgi:transposase-like protein
MDTFSHPRFHDDAAAREFLESALWPDGPVCPHCGSINNAFPVKRKGVFKGVYRCNEKECREDFTVTMKTVMERSHIALHKWLQGFHLMTSSKKGVSAHQLHRTLGITYRSAWFMAHRIREAMRDGGLVPPAPLGGEGKVVEADETYFGKVAERKPTPSRHGRPYTKGGKAGPAGKRAVLALVERGGHVRSFHVASADVLTVHGIVTANIAHESTLHTDESKLYARMGGFFTGHATVKHSAGEYVREGVHTNTIENVFSIFKRGMKGIYQHCSEKHLHRYLAEYDFRYNHRAGLGINDAERAFAAVKGAAGKRLTYDLPH